MGICFYAFYEYGSESFQQISAEGMSSSGGHAAVRTPSSTNIEPSRNLKPSSAGQEDSGSGFWSLFGSITQPPANSLPEQRIPTQANETTSTNLASIQTRTKSTRDAAIVLQTRTNSSWDSVTDLQNRTKFLVARLWSSLKGNKWTQSPEGKVLKGKSLVGNLGGSSENTDRCGCNMLFQLAFVFFSALAKSTISHQLCKGNPCMLCDMLLGL